MPSTDTNRLKHLTKDNLIEIIELNHQAINSLHSDLSAWKGRCSLYKGECRGLRKALQLLTGRIMPIKMPDPLGLLTKEENSHTLPGVCSLPYRHVLCIPKAFSLAKARESAEARGLTLTEEHYKDSWFCESKVENVHVLIGKKEKLEKASSMYATRKAPTNIPTAKEDYDENGVPRSNQAPDRLRG